jgi:hypothetical protein
MKVIIDIPDKAYELLKHKSELDNIAESIIANGIPLPKEHGDLIDSHDLETRKFIGVEEHKTLKTDDELSAYQSGWNTAIDEIIKYAPTIIPANK